MALASLLSVLGFTGQASGQLARRSTRRAETRQCGLLGNGHARVRRRITRVHRGAGEEQGAEREHDARNDSDHFELAVAIEDRDHMIWIVSIDCMSHEFLLVPHAEARARAVAAMLTRESAERVTLGSMRLPMSFASTHSAKCELT